MRLFRLFLFSLFFFSLFLSPPFVNKGQLMTPRPKDFSLFCSFIPSFFIFFQQHYYKTKTLDLETDLQYFFILLLGMLKETKKSCIPSVFLFSRILMLSLAWKKKILQRDLIYLIFTMKKQEIMMEDKEKMVKKCSKILFLKDYMEKSKVYFS